MQLFLATPATIGGFDKNQLKIVGEKLYILESFYYVQDWMKPYVHQYWHFILDSGAFTFMQGTNSEPDWDHYVDRYARYINDNHIDLFFELDIDVVVGLQEVERLRRKLENLTGKRCIPVWHKSRGKQYWLDLIQAYDYVAIGGIVSKEIKRREQHIFSWFLKTAREKGCKVHGLGYTNLEGLKRFPFYSVDSTAWIYGNRSGMIYLFNGETLLKKKRPGRLIPRQAAIHNFREWVKFQRYAEEHL